MKLKFNFLLVFLVVILVFILGVRYGQSIEKNNKIVDYLLRLPSPTAPITPTPIKYIDYKSKKWGIKFTYPAGLEVKEEISRSAVLFEMKK